MTEEKSPFIGKTVKCGRTGLLGVVIDGRKMKGKISDNVSDVISVLFTDQKKEWMLIDNNLEISDPRFIFVDD